MRILPTRNLVLVLGGTLLLAACGGGASPAASTAPTAAASSPASAAPAATELPGTKTFTVAFDSPGLSSAPYLAALDAMRAQGYTIDVPVIESSELVVQGVASGQFAFGSGAVNSALVASEAGGNLRVIAARVNNEWTVYGRSATIKECADLAGKKLAIHSEGAAGTAMVKYYISEKCPGTEPNWVIIPGSPNRMAALLADQIDATGLELGDSVKVDLEASDRFSQLASLARDLPGLPVASIYGNGDFIKNNPGTVRALLKALLTEYRRIAGDAAALKADAEKYIPDNIDPATIGAAAEKYTELEMFPVNGGMTKETLEYMIEFFGPEGTGAVKTSLPLEQWSDISHLEAVLDELGTQ